MGTQAKLGAQVTFIKQVTYKRRMSSPVVQAVVETMEQRRLLSVVTLDGTDGIDQYCIRLNPADSTQVQFFRGDGPDELIEAHPAAQVDSVEINGGAGDDSLTIDCSNGVPLNSGVLTFNGGDGFDCLRLIGQATLAVSFAPTASQGSGSISVQSQTLDYTGVENLAAVAFSAATLIPPSGPNALVITKNGEGAIVLVGQSGNTSLPMLSLRGVGSLTVDTSSNQPVGPTGVGDSIILAGSADPSWFSGLTLQLGTGQNTLDVSAAQSTVMTVVESPGTLNVSVSGNAELDVLGSQRFDSLTLTEAGVVRLAGDAGQVLNVGTVEESQWAIVDAGAGDIVYDPLPDVSSAQSADVAEEQAGGGMMQMDSSYGAFGLYMCMDCIEFPTLQDYGTDIESLHVYWGLEDYAYNYTGYIIQHVIMSSTDFQGGSREYWELWDLSSVPVLDDYFDIPYSSTAEEMTIEGWAMYFPSDPGFMADNNAYNEGLSYDCPTSDYAPTNWLTTNHSNEVYHRLFRVMDIDFRASDYYQITDADTGQVAEKVYQSYP
jgi:hypothetical protein